MKIKANEFTLEGKTVIILGGSSGLGLATAEAAANDGAKVIIVSGNQNRISEALKSLPENCSGISVDLSKEENIKNFFDAITAFDHLVYTAGENLTLHNIDETDIEEARTFFNLRYWGAFAAVKYASKKIKAGGSINLTGRTAAQRPGTGWGIAASI